MLKLYKYFNWADKKLHSLFFIESKDQIEEDLLADFKEGDGTVTTGLASHPTSTKPSTGGQSKAQDDKKKQAGIEVSQPMFVPHHEFMFGQKPGQQRQKVISVTSKNDFPTLSSGLGVQEPPKATGGFGDANWGKNVFD